MRQPWIVICPSCGLELVAERLPTAELSAICIWCANFLTWDARLTPRVMTREELDAMPEHDRRRAFALQQELRRTFN
jgi:hypothetical protein